MLFSCYWNPTVLTVGGCQSGSFRFYIHPETGKPVYEIGAHGGMGSPKRSGVIGVYYSSGIKNVLGLCRCEFEQWAIGPSAFDAIDVGLINEHSDPRYWKAKQFVIALDTLIREMFPGYGVMFREGDHPYTDP